jgi:hypothetical protein
MNIYGGHDAANFNTAIKKEESVSEREKLGRSLVHL